MSNGVWSGVGCCLAVLCAVVWCGSVTRCEALLSVFYGFMVSSTSKALKWLYGACSASGMVSRCRLCGVSVSGVVLWLAVWLFWLFSGCGCCLVWLYVSGCLCGSSGVLCVVLSLWCCRAVWCAVFWSSLVWSSGVWS